MMRASIAVRFPQKDSVSLEFTGEDLRLSFILTADLFQASGKTDRFHNFPSDSGRRMDYVVNGCELDRVFIFLFDGALETSRWRTELW